MSEKAYVPPDGQVLTPYLCCREAANAIEWYGEVFGARLREDPFVGPDGRIGHAALEIDGAPFMPPARTSPVRVIRAPEPAA